VTRFSPASARDFAQRGSRLPCDPDLFDAEFDKESSEPLDLLEGQDFFPGQKRVFLTEDLCRHAVGAAEITAIRHRDPEIS